MRRALNDAARGLSGRAGILAATAIACWMTLHLCFVDVLIHHDSWKHQFPIIFGIARQSDCGLPAAWLGMVDNGSPLIVYLISFSLTQVVLVPFLYLMSCTHPDISAGLQIYKLEIYLTYLLLSLGMYVLGRILFRHALTAVYLLVATLFAGMCLDNAHSSQIAAILFWVPWMAAFLVLALREPGSPRYFLYLNAAGLLFCAQLLDQYPHFIALVVVVAGGLFCLLGPRASLRPVLEHPWRLAPAGLALALTAAQLLIIRATIFDYAPSLRGDLIVDPSKFSEYGFLQPSAFIAMLFPISYLGGFEVFAEGLGAIAAKLGNPGLQWSIFRLDALLLGLGVIPILFAAAFLFSRADRRLRIGLAAFTGIVCLVALQPTRLYYVLLHVPFFDVFRSYFLYTIFVVFGVLVMSAYGVERLLACDTEERRSASARAVAAVAVLAGLAALVLLVAFVATPKTDAQAQEIGLDWLLDAAFLGVALTAFRAYGRARDVQGALVGLLALAMGLQIVVSAVAYLQVGVSAAQTIESYGLDAQDLRELHRSGIEASLEDYRRQQCFHFAQCYLSSRPTVSLNTDRDGTFLRHRDEPVFHQKELGEKVVKGLTGLARPVAWLSDAAVPLRSQSAAVDALRSHAADLDEFLRQQVLVYGRWRAASPAGAPGERSLELRRWEADRVSFTYSSSAPVGLVVAINHDPHWRASIAGKSARVEKANFGNISISLPAGVRQPVELEYQNLSASAALYSRLFVVALAASAAAWLAWLILRRGLRP